MKVSIILQERNTVLTKMTNCKEESSNSRGNCHLCFKQDFHGQVVLGLLRDVHKESCSVSHSTADTHHHEVYMYRVKRREIVKPFYF